MNTEVTDNLTEETQTFITQAQAEIGKRVIVSIRTVSANQPDEFSGYWGIINSIHEGGFLLEIEGGSEEKFEMLPPDISILEQAKNKFYQFNDNEVIENVDYEVYLIGANSVEELEQNLDSNTE